jgi:hypothetical protein
MHVLYPAFYMYYVSSYIFSLGWEAWHALYLSFCTFCSSLRFSFVFLQELLRLLQDYRHIRTDG